MEHAFLLSYISPTIVLANKNVGGSNSELNKRRKQIK